jgi:hypothetical protein
MNSLIKIEIPKRGIHCALRGERLLPGMEIYSLLSEDHDERLTRRDFCSVCWKMVRETEGGHHFARGYWKSKIEKQKPSEGSQRVERAFSLLLALQNDPEPREAEIFVLSLFLAHARHLALRHEFQREGITYHLYEFLRNEEFITIKAVNLPRDQIENLQRSISSQL